MALSIPPSYAHIAVEHRGAGDPQPWYVTFGILLDVALKEDCIRRAAYDYRAAFEGFLGSHVTVTGVNVVEGQDGAPLRYFVPSDGGAYVGDRTTASLPQNCAMLVDKNTALGGRRNQGRMFVPGALAEGDVDNVGVISPAVVTAWNTSLAVWMTSQALPSDATGEPYELVILHNDPGLPPELPTPITSMNAQPVISTQRRRLR